MLRTFHLIQTSHQCLQLIREMLVMRINENLLEKLSLVKSILRNIRLYFIICTLPVSDVLNI